MPNYNTNHLSSTIASDFEYGSSSENWTAYTGAGADPNSTIDTTYTSGYPTVAITSPGDQSTVGGSLSITASASDTSGISSVQFYDNWTLLGSTSSFPYTYSWTPSSGTHTIAAMAVATSGVQMCNAVTVSH